MTSDSDTKCTLVIFHSKKIKPTLFEILERMKCEICEISSLDDLLNFVHDSKLSFLHFSESSNEDPILSYHGHPIINAQDVNNAASPISEIIPIKRTGGNTKESLYKSNHMTLGEIEKIYIIKTLNKCEWKCKIAAKLLGIDRTTLYRKMKMFGIKRVQ